MRRRRIGQLAAISMLALLAHGLAASAQQRAPAAPAPAAAQGGPSFQSGGLKATVTSIAAQGSSISLALLIENKTQENLMVAVIGPPIGTHAGNVYGPVAVGGISYCLFNPHNNPPPSLERSFEINGCLKGEKPQMTLDTFTLIDAGSAVPMNVGFSSPWKIDESKDFSFSMNVAVYKESEAGADSDNALSGAKSKEQKLPKSLRYVSVGIPSLTLGRK